MKKRLQLREKVAQSFRNVSGVAKNAGVRNQMQAVFHDARYHGLYGMSSRDVKLRKGLTDKSNLFDNAGPLELSANDFQMNLAANVIEKEVILGEQHAINKNKALAADVRRVMQKSGATLPEHLPLAEPISEVKKRVRAQKKQTRLAGPSGSSSDSPQRA
jgi:DNA-damage-inducible protein D